MTFQLDDADTQLLFENCASSSSHYFDAPSNDELLAVFQTIGEQLAQTRLVQ